MRGDRPGLEARGQGSVAVGKTCHLWHNGNMKLRTTPAFDLWLSRMTPKEKAQIEARLQRIENFDHFGDLKDLGEHLLELRWKNGWRVYFTKVEDARGHVVLLLLGGLKNAQKKDMERARRLLREYTGE